VSGEQWEAEAEGGRLVFVQPRPGEWLWCGWFVTWTGSVCSVTSCAVFPACVRHCRPALPILCVPCVLWWSGIGICAPCVL